MIVIYLLIGITLLFFLASVIFICRIILKIFLNVWITTSRDELPDVHGEDVVFSSRDGTTLHGTFIFAKGKKTGATVVFCHEVGAGCGSWYKYFSFLPEAGYNVFAFDFRGHGMSGITNGYEPNQWFSHYELYDLNAALDYLEARPGVDRNRIAIAGISRGGAIAICCAAKRKNIRAIITDSAFSTYETLFDYIKRWAKVYVPVKKISAPANHFLCTISLIIAQIILKHRLPRMERYLKKIKCPILFIHGDRDNYIPVEQAHRLFARTRVEKELWTIPQARHNEAALVEPDQYRKRVTEFLHKHMD